jgi:hypothetical protein
MRHVIPILLAAASAAACATVPVAPVPVESPVEAPAPIAGLDWFLTDDPSETRLAYGMANSGDFRMAMTCLPGSGRLGLIQASETGHPEMVLESGGDTERLDATVEPAGVMDGDILLAETTTSAPALLRFRALGWLAIWQGETREILAAHPTSRPSIEQFFVLCR